MKLDDPMQVDMAQIKGPLSYDEKERRKKEGLCFYCEVKITSSQIALKSQINFTLDKPSSIH